MFELTDEEIENLEVVGEDYTVPAKTYRLDFVAGRISGMIEDSVMKQAVEKMLMTEEGAPIYMSGYGVYLNDIIGKSKSVAESLLRRNMNDTLLLDERIIGIKSFETKMVDKRTMQVSVEVSTIEGTVEIGRKVTV